jgi:hypothetical protein
MEKIRFEITKEILGEATPNIQLMCLKWRQI